jgi:hypothetical protein
LRNWTRMKIKDFFVLGENFLLRQETWQGTKAQQVAWSEPTYCHGGVWSDYGLRRRGIRAEGQSFESWLTFAMLAMDLN